MEEYRTNVYLGYKSIFDETLCLLLFEKKEDTITIDRGQKEPTPPLAIGYGVCKGGFHAARVYTYTRIHVSLLQVCRYVYTVLHQHEAK